MMDGYSKFLNLLPTLKTPIEYQLQFDKECVPLEVGKKINIAWEGKIACVSCGRQIKKSFQNGHCYVCFTQKASCDLCILKPELCHYHLGTCREPDWGLSHCFQDHIVYLANTTGLKVGITRLTNMPRRWIDQGAIQACPLLVCSNRRVSGLIEVHLAKNMSDKTKWQQLIKSSTESIDMALYHEQWTGYLKQTIDSISIDPSDIHWVDFKEHRFTYPIDAYSNKAKSLKLIPNEPLSEVIRGIKGQYLIFDYGALNLRNLQGYFLNIDLPGH
tara:strand:+ start:5429 stop:6247 length:819 start_codon:yes stop_codon:yes gene_type:complete